MDSKLRKAAQAVLDEADNPLGLLPEWIAAIEALRVALSEKTDEATRSINLNGSVMIPRYDMFFYKDGYGSSGTPIQDPGGKFRLWSDVEKELERINDQIKLLEYQYDNLLAVANKKPNWKRV